MTPIIRLYPGSEVDVFDRWGREVCHIIVSDHPEHEVKEEEETTLGELLRSLASPEMPGPGYDAQTRRARE